ncbi:Palmitoleoyl-protein carboxylesterase NOTUM [Araneus ventricosus]|uniref:Palmitoleoyl-protein carboxylesterase NOTUM n=1 Tax=Araneus ventricosus TaxID=182803 RepID=A0A4Y2HB66_ARAVE|nr:Palmitoleoyl-protein carboxylesterase NOTUM [Araneus ventricosus]
MPVTTVLFLEGPALPIFSGLQFKLLIYYIRESRSSKRWIIYLEGGWYCFDEKSCNHRWSRSRNLMSSTLWPETRSVGGILSPDPEENPYWWDANQVFLPYCSSDTWSGASHSTRKG